MQQIRWNRNLCGYKTINTINKFTDQKGISKGVVEGFLNYDAKVIKWSEREKEENLLLLSAS